MPATLRMTVRPVAATTVTKLPGRPRALRVSNPDQHRVWFLWGPARYDEPAFATRVRPGTSEVVTAGARRVEWIAAFVDGDVPVFTGYGVVRGLTPPRARRSAAGTRAGTSPGASGTYLVTYYACNESSLTPGTVTVHVRRATPMSVTEGSRAGYLRLANCNAAPVRVTFDDYDAVTRPDLVVRVAAHRVRRVHVPARFDRWYGYIGHPSGYAGWGLLPGHG